MPEVIAALEQEYDCKAEEIIPPAQRPYERQPGKKRKRLTLSNFERNPSNRQWAQLKPTDWELELGLAILTFLRDTKHLSLKHIHRSQAVATAIFLRHKTQNTTNRDVNGALPSDIRRARKNVEAERGGLDVAISIYCGDAEAVIYDYNEVRVGQKWREVTPISPVNEQTVSDNSTSDSEADTGTAGVEAVSGGELGSATSLNTPGTSNYTDESPQEQSVKVDSPAGDEATTEDARSQDKGDDKVAANQEAVDGAGGEEEDDDDDDDFIIITERPEPKLTPLEAEMERLGQKFGALNMAEPSFADSYADLDAIKNGPTRKAHGSDITIPPELSLVPTSAEGPSLPEADVNTSTANQPGEAETLQPEDRAPSFVGSPEIQVDQEIVQDGESASPFLRAPSSSGNVDSGNKSEQHLEQPITTDGPPDDPSSATYPPMPNNSSTTHAAQSTFRAQNSPSTRPNIPISTVNAAPHLPEVVAKDPASKGANSASDPVNVGSGHALPTPVAVEQPKEVEMVQTEPASPSPHTTGKHDFSPSVKIYVQHGRISKADQRPIVGTLSSAAVEPRSSSFAEVSTDMEVDEEAVNATQQLPDDMETDDDTFGASVLVTAHSMAPLPATVDVDTDMDDVQASQPAHGPEKMISPGHRSTGKHPTPQSTGAAPTAQTPNVSSASQVDVSMADTSDLGQEGDGANIRRGSAILLKFTDFLTRWELQHDPRHKETQSRSKQDHIDF